MAGVHEAHGRLLGRMVASELLAPAVDRVVGFVRRLRPVARAAAHLNESTVVAAVDRAAHGNPDSRRRGFACT
jgi:hypothetical protein